MSKHTDIIGFEANICPDPAEYSNDFYTRSVKVKLSEDFPDTVADHLSDFIYSIMLEINRNNFEDPYVVFVAEYSDFSCTPILTLYKNNKNEFVTQMLKDEDFYKELL